jgi:predicted P-loop ATPase
MERGLNQCCIVLSGKQGTGKTTIIGKLIPDELKKYYFIGQIEPRDKDSKIAAAENLIVNLDELESMNRDEITLLKSLISIPGIKVRRSYGHWAENLPRRASFIGSVNRPLFLTDFTGNRRFLVCEVLEINLEKTVNINQLYAQALELLNDGYCYWFSGEDIEMINENNEKFKSISPEDELLNAWFDVPDLTNIADEELKNYVENGTFSYMTVTDIYEILKKETSINISYKALGIHLKNAGFQQKLLRFKGKVQRVYLVVKRTQRHESNEINKQEEIPF